MISMIPCILGVCVMMSWKIYAESLSCYSCSSFTHPGDCMYLKRCKANEICFVMGRVTSSTSGNGTIVYDSGCKPRDQCKAVAPSRDYYYNNHQKRAPQTVCDMCCDETFCNWDLCDRHKQSTKGPRCLKCDTVATPEECLSVVQCERDEICFTQEYASTPRLYKLGCATEKECTPTTIQQQLVGKRQTTPSRCRQCCRADHCNHNLCEGKFPEYTLAIDETAISAGKCEDKSYELCTYTLTTLGASCSDSNVKNLCPKSCNACDDVDCVDKATFSCNEVSRVYNVCADVQKAKQYCRKFCDYCRAVDGGWTGWSSWTQCSLTCDNGTQTRSRNCSNPAPSPLGDPCYGPTSESRSCMTNPCPVDGKWTEWSMWIDCTGNCTLSKTSRMRSCTNPSPEYGGTNCTGDEEETFYCGIDPSCVVDGGWGAWSSWTRCARYCSSYTSYSCRSYAYHGARSRRCNNPRPQYGGSDCIGTNMETNPYLVSC